MHKPTKSALLDVSRGAKGLNLCPSLDLHAYFLNASGEGSCESDKESSDVQAHARTHKDYNRWNIFMFDPLPRV